MTENENEDADPTAGVSLLGIEVELWRTQEAGWTQSELAYVMGIDVAMVVAAERAFLVSREFEKVFRGK